MPTTSSALLALPSRSWRSCSARSAFHWTAFALPLRAQVRQLFERFSCPSASAVPDARFEFFKTQLWPRLAEGAGGGLLLVVPSYFDFVRIR